MGSVVRLVQSGLRKTGWAALLCPFLALPLEPAYALDRFVLTTPGADKDLTDRLRAASLVADAERSGQTDSQSVFAAARADYARLIGALYTEGFYSGVIRIRIDGREAAEIPPLDAPSTISKVEISVTPGPRFTFSKARMKPYAKGTKLPPAYGDTKIARSGAIVDAADAGVEGWRNIGHAKAEVADQIIVADHRNATLSSEILLDPGPRLRFGQLSMSGYQRMKPTRIAKIAGFPTGEVFDPKTLDKVATRLRRTGAFRSVALTEAEQPNPDGTLDIDLVVSEEKLRRFGFGAEVSNSEGLSLSGYWLHRDLFGGAERLRVDGALERIGGQDIDGVGYEVGVRIDRPATPVTDASAFVEVRAARAEIVDLTVDGLEFNFGLTRQFGDHITAEAGISYITATAKFATGSIDYELVALPLSLTWDNRDKPLDARKGYYLDADVTPFYGFGTTGSGGQIKADARAYRAFGADDRIVLAGRLHLGTVIGSSLGQTPPDYLFWSGGGGTVRGQPYQSLGVPLARTATITVETGGLSFAGFSGELRANITEKIGAVAFYDAGFVSDEELFGGNGEWHSGAGLGLRYNTGIGPIRFDVGMPVSGSTNDGVQLYVGIGQAF
ncbi:autotransporter assembly complex protein TamA [Defluviimonas sp. SAOS-178_SWC]|uniref:autotransporter assembly complex protein TamA n=1 Tax=Defluviimonas sp. SAOS-178_SWC TaxID=3121287 RepID=UPI003221DB1F